MTMLFIGSHATRTCSGDSQRGIFISPRYQLMTGIIYPGKRQFKRAIPACHGQKPWARHGQRKLAATLKKKQTLNVDNGHTTRWNDLLKMTGSSEGDDARKCVLQYYNLPQGTSVNSTNYELDYVAFIKAVRKVINTGLVYTEDDLQLDDPVKKRRRFSEYLKKILEKVPTVVATEKNAIREKLTVIENLVDLDEIDDEDDIKEIIRAIKKFYNRAQESHIYAAGRVNTKLIDSCNERAGRIFSAIRDGKKVLECKDTVESLIQLSKDPLSGVLLFSELLSVTDDDVTRSNLEIDGRMKKSAEAVGNEDIEEYEAEKLKLDECDGILEKVRK